MAGNVVPRLLTVLPIFIEAIQVLLNTETDKVKKRSLRRLQGELTIAREDLPGLNLHLHPPSDHIAEHLVELGKCLESLLTLPLRLKSPSKDGHTGSPLDELRAQWMTVESRTPEVVNQWIDLACAERNQETQLTLLRVMDNLEKSSSGAAVDPTSELNRRWDGRAEPPYVVSRAARSVFEALVSRRGCTCDPPHHFNARLSLATYRDSDFASEDFEFDVLLSVEQNCHEVKIGAGTKAASKTGKVRVTFNDEPTKASSTRLKEIKQLCKPIHGFRKKFPQWRTHYLHFLVEDGSLWNKPPGKSALPVDKDETTISLETFLTTKSSMLTEKTKRMLAVLLAHALLHLHGTPWLRHDWGPSNIEFREFRQESSSVVPLRPYIQLQLAESIDIHQTTQDDDDTSSDTSDDFFDFGHPLPHFATLGLMLMQIYMAKTFAQLAAEFGEDPEVMGDGHKFSLAQQVFNRHSKVVFTERYRSAVNECLNPEIHKDDAKNDLDEDTFRKVIYDKIISPLEDELAQGKFSEDDLVLSLDSHAHTTDMANLGHPIQFDLDPQTGQRRLSRSPSPALHQPKSLETGRSLFSHGQEWSSAQLKEATAHRMPENGRELVEAVVQNPIKRTASRSRVTFFDQYRPVDVSDQTDTDSDFEVWKDHIRDTYEKFLDSRASHRNIKIAVLDTGIDLKHADFLHPLPRRPRIQECLNFDVPNGQAPNDDVRDTRGHGTHIAGLLVEFAPDDAAIYVGRVDEEQQSLCASIAKGIRYAVDTWRVDIISLSLGVSSRYDKDYDQLELAIEHAAHNHVLVFAAASNGGANQERAFPARHDSVICVHSTDAAGNPSNFNPRPVPTDLNFATLGEGMKSAWPETLCLLEEEETGVKNQACIAWKSGTSFATPVAVGIASFLLRYGQENLTDREVALLRRPKGMRAVLGELSRDSDGFKYLAPRVHPDHLFGEEKDYVKKHLAIVLRRS